ncbi:hypothetical protein K439DRAFT_1619450 [Ramaria rubella]|nr:hypothetical protein K439DRAFT_1619450 [Ramaria rubella]
MFSLAVLALASVASSANALVIPRSTIPATYAVGYLEDYHVYHTRYLALNCESQHNTSFFDDCCHPLLATENLQDDRPAFCIPSASASSSAALAEPTSTDVPSGDDDCDDNDESSSPADPAPTSAAPENVAPDPIVESSNTPASSSPSPTPTPSSTPSSTPAPSPSPSPSPKSPPPPKPSPASSSPAPAPSSSSDDGLSGIVGELFTGGIATFFFQNGVAGACGTVHSDSDKIVALQTDTYGNGEHCGKQIMIKDPSTGHTAFATVADECPTCNNKQCIDMSQGLFDEFATAADGEFNVEWGFTGN